MLGDVVETVYVVDEDDEEGETLKVLSRGFLYRHALTLQQTIHKKSEMLFVRGKSSITGITAHESHGPKC